MKKRSKAGGEPIKGPRRKTPEPKRRNATKAAPRSNSSHDTRETEVARLAGELSEALERQTATSEVLNVISSSPGELDPVFNAILQNAARICQAQFGTLNLYDGSAFRTVALHNPPPQFAVRLGQSWRPHPESGLAYVAQSGQVAHIDDIRTRPPYLEGDKAVVELAHLGGARTLLIAPMLDKGKLIGAISIYRQEVRAFTDNASVRSAVRSVRSVVRCRSSLSSRAFSMAMTAWAAKFLTNSICLMLACTSAAKARSWRILWLSLALVRPHLVQSQPRQR